MKAIVCPLLIAACLGGGCETFLVARTDREVYHLIQGRQTASLEATSDASIEAPTASENSTQRMYDLNPRPVDSEVPPAFAQPPEPAESVAPEAEEPSPKDQPNAPDSMSPNIFAEDELDRVQVIGLRQALAYAMIHAREFQSEKEELYLAALDLTLERHLWTPQFEAVVEAVYEDFARSPNAIGSVAGSTAGASSSLSRSLSTQNTIGVTQRLPFGGELSALVVHGLLREVRGQVGKRESGQLVLAGEIPLLRGAGQVAYESRYTAERGLIYAVRDFERFRRTFLVRVAGNYFNLQQLKATIANTYRSYENRKQDWEKADFIHRMGRSRTIFDAPRAKANLRSAESVLVSAKERYELTLDRFKIFIGMPVDTMLDVLDQEQDDYSKGVDGLLGTVDETTAIETALRYRLDLLNSADRVDDARRVVLIAKNQILPDLTLTGSVTFDSDPNQLRPATLRNERATWAGGIQWRIDDRRTERNAYRRELVELRRAQRGHDEFTDSVRADVRGAVRRVVQQQKLRMIQTLNVSENELRLEAARAQFDLGRSTNQDVVDAENDLLRARNDLTAALADFRVAILEFRRDTGTLRVADDGRWGSSGPEEPPPGDAG